MACDDPSNGVNNVVDLYTNLLNLISPDLRLDPEDHHAPMIRHEYKRIVRKTYRRYSKLMPTSINNQFSCWNASFMFQVLNK